MESRTPPQNLDAEQSVLGSILLDNDVYAALEGTLRPEHFYKESHRKLFKAIERLYQSSEPMDLVTLTEELRRSGELDDVGNVPYLIGLADSVPTAAYAESYARIVVEKAVLRDLIGASGQIMQRAYDQSTPLEEVLDAAERSIFELSSSKRAHRFGSMGELVTETFAHINELFSNPDPVSGLRTGFKELDQMTAGLQASSLNVLAARPSMGKTALALSIALNAALRENKTVGLFSLEMSGVQLVTRMLCSEARVDMSRVRNGQLTDRDFQRLADTAGRMSDARIFIDDNADMTVMELRSRARRLMAEHDLGLIVIDYLQLMSGATLGRFGSENRQQEISSISRGLKALARELDVPVLVLSQLSRAVESRPNKRPMLSDLRECVPGDTLVNLADGRRIPIRDLVGTAPCVLAVDDHGKVVPARSDAVWPVGTRPVLELRTASGRCLRATPNHRVLTEDGWRRLGRLAAGDRLALARRLPQPAAPASWSDDEVILLGNPVGDGSRLPAEAFRLPNRQVALLLHHLWAANGCIRTGPEGTDGSDLVAYEANSRGRADDVAALLLRLGMVARIVTTARRGDRPGHQVCVSGRADQVRFLESMDAFGAREPQARRLARARRDVRPHPNRDVLPRERFVPSRATRAEPAVLPSEPALATTADDDLHWDEITQIRPAGEEEVFDLTVPGPASWLADGLVSHNSGAIEQDADLVMFIYRDEYYDPQSEKQGIAEIIVGKQRNGPVGALDLQFHNAHVRFNDLARATP